MEKYSITVPSGVKALKINRMIENHSPWDAIVDYPLHVGINYTSEPLVYECAKKMMEIMGNNFVRVEPMGKDFVLRKEFNKFRFVDEFSVFLEYESEYYTLTLYYQHMELVSITFDDGLKDPYKKYMVYVNWPYYENGEHGFVVRKEESDKQHVFLETNSAKVAFNMVNRIVANMRYPKAKKIW